MAKDTFFDDEEEDLDEDGNKGNDGEGEKTPPAEEKKGGEEMNKSPEDKDNWKERFEALEAERKNERYRNEMLRFNDTLEGDNLDDLEGGKRYRELRELGLSEKEAYAAVATAFDTEDSTTKRNTTGKGHVGATDFRRSQPTSKMDRMTKAIAREIFGDDVSDEELETLYRKVSK